MAIRRIYYYPQNLSSLEGVKPKVAMSDAFKDDEVVCMICGQGGMKTLARHLNFIHNVDPTQYRRLFGIKRTQKLTSGNYSELRRQFAEEKVTPDQLAKAREARGAAIQRVKAEGDSPAGADVPRMKRVYRRLHIFGGL